MRVKEKLKFVIPTLILLLLVLSYFNFKDGFYFKSQVVTINSFDKKVLNELTQINQVLKLNTIENNVRDFMVLVKNTFIDVDIKNINSEKPKAGIDRVGEFRDFIITTKGDYLNQIYLLEKINESMRTFLVINSIDASEYEMKLNIRIYGRTNDGKKQ
jgi:hypothetical protein